MPITKSASKALRRDKRKTNINKPIKTKYKTAVKNAALEPTEKNLKLAYKHLDRAVKKGIIHKNKASRLKSQLAKKVKSKKPVKKPSKTSKKKLTK
jgi:small subunit ribosomal protein S20